MEEIWIYSRDANVAIGMPKRTGRREMLDTRAFAPGPALLIEERSRAFLTPSRDKNKIVDSKSSNWMAAVPNV